MVSSCLLCRFITCSFCTSRPHHTFIDVFGSHDDFSGYWKICKTQSLTCFAHSTFNFFPPPLHCCHHRNRKTSLLTLQSTDFVYLICHAIAANELNSHMNIELLLESVVTLLTMWLTKKNQSICVPDTHSSTEVTRTRLSLPLECWGKERGWKVERLIGSDICVSRYMCVRLIATLVLIRSDIFNIKRHLLTCRLIKIQSIAYRTHELSVNVVYTLWTLCGLFDVGPMSLSKAICCHG